MQVPSIAQSVRVYTRQQLRCQLYGSDEHVIKNMIRYITSDVLRYFP